MYKIKESPEDFIVKEIIDLDIVENGKFLYFKLKKKNWTTLRAIKAVSSILNIPLNRIGYAGNKDKLAVTEQVCSIPRIAKEKLNKIKLDDLEVSYLGHGNEKIFLGALKANEFEITVRNLEVIPDIKPCFINLYGAQRFSKSNHRIGRLLVHKDFKKATELIMESSEEDQKILSGYLSTCQNDYVGGLRKLDHLKIYVHAFQSILWNELAPDFPDETVPIPGFGTRVPEVLKFLENMGLKPLDFVIKQIPELSAKGGQRQKMVCAEDLKVDAADDDCFPGKKKAILKFNLPPGSYATVFIESIFS